MKSYTITYTVTTDVPAKALVEEIRRRAREYDIEVGDMKITNLKITKVPPTSR